MEAGEKTPPPDNSPDKRQAAEEVKLMIASIIGAETLGLMRESLKEVLEMMVGEIKAAQIKAHAVDTKLVSKFMVFEK